MKINAIIPAGGTSSRFGAKNKLIEKINGKEVICYTAEVFEYSNVNEIIICAHPTIIKELETIFKDFKKIRIVQGGNCRQQSVFNGLKSDKCDYVLIHDAARPVISSELVNRTIEYVVEKHAVAVATKTTDTIKEVQDGKIIRTIDRAKLYNTQTPQAFEYNLILNAHKKLEGQNFTDDAGMLEYLGETVYILDGSYKNIKITTLSDIDIAKIYLNK